MAVKRIAVNIPQPQYDVFRDSKEALIKYPISDSKYILYLALIGLESIIKKLEERKEDKNDEII